MGDRTGISWTDATWNPVRGCSRVSEGCRNCYAERVAARFSGPGQPYEGLAVAGKAGSKWTGEVRLVPEHLGDPLRWQKPRRVFVNSMSDLFHEKLSNEQIAAVFGVMAAAPRHTFQVLTKRAKRMRDWFRRVGDEAAYARGALRLCGDSADRAGAQVYRPRGKAERSPWNDCRCVWPLPNVWLGVSVENQAAADERIPLLLETPAAVRFLSCEPLLGPLNLNADRIGWVIAGCESGPGARPCEVAWLRSLRGQCEAAGVPFFLKQAVEGDGITAGPGSKRKSGGVIELPYLDGVLDAAMPEVSR